MEVVHLARKDETGLREAIQGGEVETRVLCWNCKRMTPVAQGRCASCGSKIVSPAPRPPTPPRPARIEDDRELEEARRSLLQLFEDLQRVSDVSAYRPSESEPEEGPLLFQCPSCGRFVAEDAVRCACGVHFADQVQLQYSCPRCGALVAEHAQVCRCGVRFEE